MLIDKIYTRNNTKFAQRIELWCADRKIEALVLDKEDKWEDEVEGLVIFHEDHNLDANGIELRDAFEKKLRPIHKMDVNGTKQVSASHFGLWLERNNCKKVLMIGTDSLIENPNFETLLGLM
ncbi:MAG: hypothetical protein N4A41_06630 [Crocinitomicaceae bacterium]|jgi:hypothetical protein|nr:hypothetical protein [Crocinitomicaceae bacterium]